MHALLDSLLNSIIECESVNRDLLEELTSLKSNASMYKQQLTELKNTCSGYENEIKIKNQALIGSKLNMIDYLCIIIIIPNRCPKAI